MNDYYLKATFWKKGVDTYRNKTKIIFNENEEDCIGIILMLNPGSSLPIGDIPEEPREFPLTCLCGIDYTLRKLPICISESYKDYPQLLEGYVLIVNLSNKCGTKPEKLSEGDFRKTEDIVKEIKEVNSQIKWIWIAFGTDKNLKLCTAKKAEVLSQLQSYDFFKNKLVGVCSMHPSHPFFDKHQNHNKIINEIRNKLKNNLKNL